MPLNHQSKLLMKTALVILFAIFIGGCGDQLLEVEFENDPVGNFDALWNEFDRYYALFDARQVDWDSLYSVYRPLVNNGSTDAKLFEAMTGLLAPLQDEHVRLYAPGLPRFRSGSEKERLLFSDSDPDSFYSDEEAMVNTALNEYLDSIYVNAKKYDLPDDFSAYGIISPDYTDLVIGYVVVLTFSLADVPTSYYDALVNAFRDCDGVIIDIRTNGGGSTGTSGAFIRRFADKERAYAVSRYRNGPDHSDYTAPVTYYLSPTDNALGDVPVVMLTSRFTASAAEDVILGAKVLPLATVVGDTTIGILGAISKKVLPNGWEFTLSPELTLSIDGVCYEGSGIPPDIQVMATRADVDAGQDAVIDRAIEILESAVR